MSRRNGILCYTAEDIPRNQWFIRELCRCAEPEGISLRLCTAQDGIAAAAQAELLINRSRDHRISAYCEETLQIPVHNSTAVTYLTNDKFRTDQFLHLRHGLPTAPTVLVAEGTASVPLHTPLVAKPLDGHGGKDVTWIADAAALEDALRYRQRPFLLQQPMITGWDMRVYVLGSEIYAAVLRTAEEDFRSNFSLGGRARVVQPDAEIRELVRRVLNILPLDFAGIDFLRTPDGGYVIGEIEDAVGCRMLYQLTALNPAQDFIRLIAKQCR